MRSLKARYSNGQDEFGWSELIGRPGLDDGQSKRGKYAPKLLLPHIRDLTRESRAMISSVVGVWWRHENLRSFTVAIA